MNFAARAEVEPRGGDGGGGGGVLSRRATLRTQESTVPSVVPDSASPPARQGPSARTWAAWRVYLSPW